MELLATLVGAKLWIPEESENRTSRVAIRGYTDDQSNESLLRKFMTSKFLSTLILMELVEELSFRHCDLKLRIRRDINQLADNLTKEVFDAFGPECKVNVIASQLEWCVRVLELLNLAEGCFQEVRSHKETKPARFQKGAKRRRLDPWI